MTRHGFETFPHEGWHFDWKGWQDDALLDFSFSGLSRRRGGMEGVLYQRQSSAVWERTANGANTRESKGLG